jgi:hypothetical protein
LVRPVTVIGDPAALALMPPGLDVAVYAVIAAPPFDTGAPKLTVACVLPAVADTEVGAPGTVRGVTLFDGAEGALTPAMFVAVTVNVYAVPLVRPVTVMGDPAELALMPPGFDVAVYEVIDEPPSDAGGAKVTVACALPAVAVPMTGAPGTPGGATGVTLFDAAEGGPAPNAFVAVTVKVYEVPFARPVTVSDGPGPVAVNPPGFESAVYDVIGEPPFDAGAVNVTVACALPAVAVPMTGAPGTVPGVTLLDGADSTLLPAALVACTVNV